MEYLDVNLYYGGANANIVSRAVTASTNFIWQIIARVWSIFPFVWSYTMPVVWRLVLAMLRYISNGRFMVSILGTAVLNRTLVFASTRRPIKPPYYMVVLLRGGLTAFYCWLLPQFLPQIAFGTDTDLGAKLSRLQIGLSISFYIELLLAGLEKKEPHFDAGYTMLELSLILHDFSSTYGSSKTVYNFCTLVVLAQILLHIRGMIPGADRYRLVFSTFVSVSFITNFLYEMATNGIISSQFPAMMLTSLLRHGPQLILAGIVATCWSIYFSAALVLGSRQHLNMYTQQEELLVQWSDGLFLCLLKRAIHCLITVPNANYLHETPEIRKPLCTFLEATVLQQRKQQAGQVYGLNGYDVASDGDSAYAAMIEAESATTTNGESSMWWVDTLWTPIFVRTKASWALVHWCYYVIEAQVSEIWDHLWRRSTSAHTSHRYQQRHGSGDYTHGFTDYRYNWLDKGRPGAHLALMLDAPELDDSPDWDPSTAAITESESESEFDTTDIEEDEGPGGKMTVMPGLNRETVGPSTRYAERSSEKSQRQIECENDIVFAAQSTLELLAAPGGADIVAAHMAGKVTRSGIRMKRSHDVAQILLERRGYFTQEALEAQESLCVICCSNPREVLLWPCRCLAICDDCRIALSAKNFKDCVCCRRKVASYSRIYTP